MVWRYSFSTQYSLDLRSAYPIRGVAARGARNGLMWLAVSHGVARCGLSRPSQGRSRRVGA